MAEKSQEQIKDELRQFEHSINEIDSKFVILNNNLIKYQELTDHARNALLSRDATGSKQGNATSRARMRCDFSSGLPTDRIIDDSSSMLNVEDVSQNADSNMHLTKVMTYRGQSNTNDDSNDGEYDDDFEDEPVGLAGSQRVSPHGH